jgi:hypothetical protein
MYRVREKKETNFFFGGGASLNAKKVKTSTNDNMFFKKKKKKNARLGPSGPQSALDMTQLDQCSSVSFCQNSSQTVSKKRGQ